jgi:hypothetical protein
MKLLRAVTLGLIGWGVMRALRTAQGNRPPAQKDVMTRWEGEGGAIPEVPTPEPGTAEVKQSS